MGVDIQMNLYNHGMKISDYEMESGFFLFAAISTSDVDDSLPELIL